MADPGYSAQACMGCVVVFILYYLWDLTVTKRIVHKRSSLPLTGSPTWWAPRFFLNLLFAANATEIIEAGYQKASTFFKKQTFQLIRGDGSVIILPLHLIDELSSLPPSVASNHGALERDLLGPYTGLDIILTSRMHHTIVQRKLTPRLRTLAPALQDELTLAVDEAIPNSTDWTEIVPYKVLGEVAARMAARAMVGPSFCRDPRWLDISVNYTENLFRTIVVLRMFPRWTHPILSRCLPSFWAGNRYLQRAKEILGPTVDDLIRKNDAGLWTPDSTENDFNVLCWLVEAARGADRNADTLVHIEVLLGLAAVHTTLLRMVNVLYEVTADRGLLEELVAEIQHVSCTREDWDFGSYGELHKLDSVLRESQRLSPPTILGLKRLFLQPHTFSSGLSIPAGTYVALPVMAIENDPLHTENPQEFDGLRSYRAHQCSSMETKSPSQRQKSEHQFSSIEKTVLGFGYGRTACPGRFFASLTLKMTFVKLLAEYEFQFLPGTGRPKNYLVHEFLFPWPWDKILVRRREGGVCPF
ncbi:cytochrome P450 [Aspergillus recurvatus]